jgi:hypothetical protein
MKNLSRRIMERPRESKRALPYRQPWPREASSGCSQSGFPAVLSPQFFGAGNDNDSSSPSPARHLQRGGVGLDPKSAGAFGGVFILPFVLFSATADSSPTSTTRRC